MHKTNPNPQMKQPKTGIHPKAIPVSARSLTTGERVELWFIKPLQRMRNDDGFVALMVCLPLIEKIVRYKTANECTPFSQGSDLINELARFLQISEANAEIFWQQFRNGLLHRAMVKPSVPYQLDPEHKGAPVSFAPGGAVLINIWRLRDQVVTELSNIGTKIWKDGSCPLPEIYLELAQGCEKLLDK
jgi:hypothetical protein